MIGIYKYDDCIIKDPSVVLVDISKYFATEETELIVRIDGENKGHVLGLTDGCEIVLKDDGSMPPVTNEPALRSWAETQLQKIKI